MRRLIQQRQAGALAMALAIALAVALAGCGGGSGGGGTSFAPAPGAELQPAFPNLSFSKPLALLQAPGDDDRWFVVEQSGVVRVFMNDDQAATTTTFIDITSRVGDSSGERGLLGLAFDPDFAVNGHVYLSYTRSAPTLVSYLSRFTSVDGGQTLDPSSEVVILTLQQPYANHNGGHVAFGPDGLLYAAFGDGGSANDPGNRAQDTSNLFGSIIRIDVATLPYSIPAGNPFVGNAHCAAGSGSAPCPEIFAWGLRNPWRFSFDRETGVLWAGDVGQGAWEEVNRIVGGRNYGWRIREGAHCNIPPGDCPTMGLEDPVAEYDHAAGSSITGGYVYRGSRNPPLRGSYVFGDFVSGRVFRLASGGSTVEEMLDTGRSISSFAEANDGEMFLVDYAAGTLHRLTPP